MRVRRTREGAERRIRKVVGGSGEKTTGKDGRKRQRAARTERESDKTRGSTSSSSDIELQWGEEKARRLMRAKRNEARKEEQ